MSTNFFKDNADLKYYLEKGVDWDPLVRITELDYSRDDGHKDLAEAKEFYTDVLNLSGEFVANEVNPKVEAIDRKKVKLVDGEAVESEEWVQIFDHIKELGLPGLPVPREFGGMNAPVLIYFMNAELLGRADVSAMTHYSFHAGIALALLVYSVQEGTTEVDPETLDISSTRFQQAIEEMASGAAWGSMDITEPDAGSDMGALTTRARQDEDGNWFITGSKIFITSGHGKWHIVIARSEDDASLGLDGLSLFLVKAFDDKEDGTRERYVDIVRIEEKLGHNGSATCALDFTNVPAQLIGERGDGFKLMLLLMNNARVGVGFESLGVMQASFVAARDYAAERRSMGKTIDKHEMIAEYLETLELEIAAQRALCMHAGFHEELAHKLNMYGRAMLDSGRTLPTFNIETRDDLDAAVAAHQWDARRITPLLKYYGGEKAVEHAQMAIQIHGGVGYTKDYTVEKLLRDAMVLPVYEGTSQIQSLMAMKDNVGRVLKDPQAFFTSLAQARWRSVSASSALERRVAKLEAIKLQATLTLLTKTASDKFRDIRHLPFKDWKGAFVNMDPKRDFSFAMLHAERFMNILIQSTVADLFLAQTQKHPEREQLLVRWLEKAEPEVRYLMDKIQNTGDRLLERLDAEDGNEAAAE